MASSNPGVSYTVTPNAPAKNADVVILFFERPWLAIDDPYLNDILREFGQVAIGSEKWSTLAGYNLLTGPGGPLVLLLSARDKDSNFNGNDLRDRLVDALTFNFELLSKKKVWIGVRGDAEGRIPLDWLLETIIGALQSRSERILRERIVIEIALPGFEAQSSRLKELRQELNSTLSNGEKEAKKSEIDDEEEDEPVRQGEADQVAGILSDSEKGKDRFGIGEDVSAFARVMAAKSFEPPLAIALFGKWGSGKSFFMRMLQEEITELSKQNFNGYFCEGVVHIRFNAWSYLDANLWASIMTRIFEGLNEFIHQNIPEEALGKIGEDLNKQLNISKREVASLEVQKDSIREQIDTLEKHKKDLDRNIRQNIRTIRERTAWQVIENVDKQFEIRKRIGATLKDNPGYVRTEEELKKIIPEKYWDDPDIAYREVRSKATFLREFFRSEKIFGNLFWLAFILAMIFLVPAVLQLFLAKLRTVNFTLTQAGISLLVAAGGIWRRAEATYIHLQPIAAPFWKIKEEHENLVKAALARFEQDEKARRLEIEKEKAELVVVEQQLNQNKAIQAQLEFKISNALSTEALYSFIEKRSKSEDYSKHLGLISIIRRDFEMLSFLFAGHQVEIANIEKAEELKAQFKANFRKPLERIILYIDDLDRCPVENVVQVLEAVNLLMAYPLFVVVVGVDLSWIRNALLRRHGTQFRGTDAIDPARYLEKIIQVPFYLQEANDDQVKRMLTWLAQWQFEFDAITEPTRGASVADEDTGRARNNPGGSGNTSEGADSTTNEGSAEPTKEKPVAIPELHRIVAFIDDDEIVRMRALSRVVGSNPRAIKRFVNSYRIIKCHEGFQYKESEIIGILFLLALPIGPYRSLLHHFEGYIVEPFNELRTFADWLASPHGKSKEQERLADLREDLKNDLEPEKAYEQLAEMPVRVLAGYNDFVSRFTFKDSR